MRTLVGYLNDRRIGTTLNEGNDLWNGGTERPIQWYFDNLLPEEQMREALSKKAKIHRDDAFALLEYLGAESILKVALNAAT